jgi:hypothetical protein
VSEQIQPSIKRHHPRVGDECSDTRIGDPGRPGLLSLPVASDEGVPTQHEENVRQQILEGLIAAKGGGLVP